MSISIRNPRVEILAKDIAAAYQITMTQAIIDALEEKKERMKVPDASEDLRLEKILSIAGECAALPDLDPRRPDDILGYDQNGGL